MSFPISGAGKRTASTGKVFGENTGTRVRMIFPETCKARPCGWKRAVPLPLPLNWNGSALFPLPSLGLGEREFQVEVRVKGYRGVERGPFLALDPLDQPGGAGREKLFQMLVGQLLVQETAEHQQSAPLMVALGDFCLHYHIAGLALGAGKGA